MVRWRAALNELRCWFGRAGGCRRGKSVFRSCLDRSMVTVHPSVHRRQAVENREFRRRFSWPWRDWVRQLPRRTWPPLPAPSG